jgi:hypothetical protein
MQLCRLLVKIPGFLVVAKGVVSHPKVSQHCSLLSWFLAQGQGLQEGLHCQREQLELGVTQT